MHIPSTIPASDRQPCLLTFARAHDAQIFVIRADLSPTETTRLVVVLDQLIEVGALAIYRVNPPLDRAADWQELVELLRDQLGAIITDAVVASSAYSSTPTPKPQTLVPVWAFESLDAASEVLTACGVFSGVPIVFEALPVEDADLTQPLPSVAVRFAAWRSALDQGTMLCTAAIAGRDRAYAVFASLRAG